MAQRTGRETRRQSRNPAKAWIAKHRALTVSLALLASVEIRQRAGV